MSGSAVITMSGVCYEIAARPAVKGGRIPGPKWRKVGKGLQAVWPYSDDLLSELWWRVEDLLDSAAGGHLERSSMKDWCNRYRNRYQEVGRS